MTESERPPAPQVAVGAVVRRGGSTLLVQRGTEPQKGRWSIPGGRVEPGEPLAQAVERETLEETGLIVACGEFVGWVERVSAEHHFVILDFLAIPADDAHEPVASSDAAAARFVPDDELGDLDLVDGLLDFLIDHAIIDGAINDP
jgi:8-oxo-dGTP diphosphatase